jgi:hypothetical protein
MRFAYADPPYLGCCSLYAHDHFGGGCWDDVGTHLELIERLGRDYRDHLDEPPALSEPITMRKGFTGAKPERFCHWVLDLLGWKQGDQVDDLYVGTGVFDRVLAAREGRELEVDGQVPLDFGEPA